VPPGQAVERANLGRPEHLLAHEPGGLVVPEQLIDQLRRARAGLGRKHVKQRTIGREFGRGPLRGEPAGQPLPAARRRVEVAAAPHAERVGVANDERACGDRDLGETLGNHDHAGQEGVEIVAEDHADVSLDRLAVDRSGDRHKGCELALARDELLGRATLDFDEARCPRHHAIDDHARCGERANALLVLHACSPLVAVGVQDDACSREDGGPAGKMRDHRCTIMSSPAPRMQLVLAFPANWPVVDIADGLRCGVVPGRPGTPDLLIDVAPLFPLPEDVEAWTDAALRRDVPPGAVVERTESASATTALGWPVALVCARVGLDDADGRTAVVERRMSALYAFNEWAGHAVARGTSEARWEAHLSEIVEVLRSGRPDWSGPDVVAALIDLWR